MSDLQDQSPDRGDAICQFLATGFYLGSLAPFAPGTLGTAMGIPLAWALAWLAGLVADATNVAFGHLLFIAAVAVLFLIGVPICTRGQRRLGKKDPGEVIWDEIATAPLVFFLLPFSLLNSPWVLLIGFALHRLFDISKPPPCKQLERVPEGWGVMLDDLVAAIYGMAVMHGLYWTGVLDRLIA